MTVKNLYVKSNSKVNAASLTKAKIKKFLKIPAIQFLILGLAFAIIQLLCNKGIIPSKYGVVASNIIIYTIVCVGFCLLLGYAGLASLGSACFVGIGAYCTYFALASFKVPYIIGILMALAISLLLGLAIGFISLRVQGLFLGIITLGLSEIIRIVLRQVRSEPLLLRNSALKLFGIVVKTKGMVFALIVMMVICLILISNLMNSPTGRNMIAMKSSTSAAQAFGVNLLFYRVLAFIIACMTASLTGVAYLSTGFSITPANSADPVLSITLSLNVLAAVIIGGYKSIWGTFGGTCFVFGLSSLFSAIFPNFASAASAYVSLFIGVLMILVVMFYPGGITQLIFLAKYKIKQRKLRRKVETYGLE